MTDLFETQPPSTPAWTPPGLAPSQHSWARRRAIHRLDLEHTAADSAAPGSVPPLFPGPFAADGIDELFTQPLPPADATGTVLFRADDATTGWWLAPTPATRPTVTRLTTPAAGATATVEGPADAIPSRLAPPHTATTTGPTTLLQSLHTP